MRFYERYNNIHKLVQEDKIKVIKRNFAKHVVGRQKIIWINKLFG